MQTSHQDIIGWFGAVLVVCAYALLTLTHLTQTSIIYNLMNLIGGLFLGYRVWVDRNYSNVFLEVIFVGIALYALLRSFLLM